MPGLDQKGIGNITLGNIYSKSSGQLYHHVTGGNTMEDKTEFFRGLAFKYNGKLYAGSDGKGFDATVLTGSQIDQEINENTTIVSIVQEILQDSTKKDISLEQVEQLILDGKIGDFNVWRSSRESGVPSGWLNASQIVPDLIKQGSHEVKKEVTKVIQKEITNPGTYKFIPGEEYVYSTTELNPVVVAAEAGLASLEAVEWNDLLRYTRSQESILRRHPKLLEAMKEENDKKRESNKENANKENNIENDKQTKAKKLRDIASYQRNNKSKSRHYTYSGETMHKATEQNKKTVWEQFYGTKKEDFKSGYDENAIHVNDKEDTIDFEERE